MKDLTSIIREFASMVDTLPQNEDSCALAVVTDGSDVSFAMTGNPMPIVQMLVSAADKEDRFAKILVIAARVVEQDLKDDGKIEVVRLSGPKKNKEYIN